MERSPEMQEGSTLRYKLMSSGGLAWRRNGPEPIPGIEEEMDNVVKLHWSTFLRVVHDEFDISNTAACERKTRKPRQGAVHLYPEVQPIMGNQYIVGIAEDDEKKKTNKKAEDEFTLVCGYFPSQIGILNSPAARAAQIWEEREKFKRSQEDIIATYRRPILLEEKNPPVNSTDGMLGSLVTSDVPFFAENAGGSQSLENYMRRKQALDEQRYIIDQQQHTKRVLKALDDMASSETTREKFGSSQYPLTIKSDDYVRYNSLPPPPFHPKFYEITERATREIYRCFGVEPFISSRGTETSSASWIDKQRLDIQEYYKNMCIILMQVSKKVFENVTKLYNRQAKDKYDSEKPYYEVYLRPPKPILTDVEISKLEQAASKEDTPAESKKEKKTTEPKKETRTQAQESEEHSKEKKKSTPATEEKKKREKESHEEEKSKRRRG